MYGLRFTKADNAVIRQMVIALFDKHDYLQSCMTIKEAVTGYNLALNDAVHHVKHAAGMSVYAHLRLSQMS